MAARNLQPAELSVTSGQEDTISHYRRLLADDGHVVMNWEPYPPEQIVRPLGVADPEVGVVKVVAAGDPNDPAETGPRPRRCSLTTPGTRTSSRGTTTCLVRTIPASPRGCWRKNWAAWRSSSTVRSAPWILTAFGIVTGRASTGQAVRSPAVSARPRRPARLLDHPRSAAPARRTHFPAAGSRTPSGVGRRMYSRRRAARSQPLRTA